MVIMEGTTVGERMFSLCKECDQSEEFGIDLQSPFCVRQVEAAECLHGSLAVSPFSPPFVTSLELVLT